MICLSSPQLTDLFIHIYILFGTGIPTHVAFHCPFHKHFPSVRIVIALSLIHIYTGEHLLSGVIKSQFGYDNVGFHIGPDVVRVDVSGPLSDGELQEIEQAVNWVIWQNGPVRARCV